MRPKKLQSPVTLFAAIEESQYESLRTLAFKERQSIAEVVRTALAEYLGKSRNSVRSHSEPVTRHKALSSTAAK
jgi:hypothetical protein